MIKEINTKVSVNTDTVNEDFHAFTEEGAPLICNTGIEREGGVTNLYEKETLYGTAGEYVVTDEGDTISLVVNGDFRTIAINGQNIGSVSAYGIESRLEISGVDDVALMASSYMTMKLVSGIITVTEFSYAGVQLNTRNITFTNLGSVLALYTSISLVKYTPMAYADSLEFALRLGEQVIILQESNLTVTITQALQSSSVLGTSNINCSITYGTFLVFAGNNGRVGSFDGTSWKNYDGTGLGIGPYNNGDVTFGVIGSNNILAMTLYTYGASTWLVVGGAGGRVGSFNGLLWNKWDSTFAISNNAAVVSNDNVTALASYSGQLFVGSAAGKIGSWSGTAWTLYSSATAGAPCDNATVLGAVSINSMISYNGALLVAGASGRIGSIKSGDGLIWSFVTTTAPGAGWVSVAYGNGVWVAVAVTTSTTAGIARSTDGGATWSFVTTTAPGAEWISVAYGNGVWVAVAFTTSTTAGIARSTNGGATWSFVTTTTPGGSGWFNVAYGNGVWVALANTTSTTAGIARSTDGGATWSFVTTTAPAAGWVSVAYGNGVWVALGFTTSTTAGIARSTDGGATWSFVTTTAPGAGWVSVAYGNGVWVAVASTTSTTAGIARSTNGGATWSFVTTTAPASGWNSAAYGNNVWVAVARTNSTTAGIARSTKTQFYKSIYTSTSNSELPTNNATVLGANAIQAAIVKGVYYIVGGVGGRLGSFDGSTWNVYTAGSGIADNATILGANDIKAFSDYPLYVVVGGVGGRLGSLEFNVGGSFVGKHLYTDSTTIANNATLIGANAINALLTFGVQILAAGDTGVVNAMSTNGAFNSFYNDGGSVIANLLTGFNSFGYLYIYRYENGLYLVNLAGNALNKSYTLNNSTKAITTITAKYCVLQVSGGFSRHIVSADDTAARHIYDGSSIKCIGFVGYTDFLTFSGAVVYPDAAFVLGNGFVLQSISGYNYADFTFRLTSSAVNVYNYTPQFIAPPNSPYQVVQGNTNTLINAYGKLTNAIGLVPSKPFEFRTGLVAGFQSFLSAALLDGNSRDALGVLITNFDEFDDTFVPMIQADETILYKYDNKYVITKIGKNAPSNIQKISSEVYKLNSLSPQNIIDTVTKVLSLGSIDYNNRLQFINTSAPSATASNIASMIYDSYANSIDSGDKLITIASPTIANYEVIGYRVPYIQNNAYGVDVYLGDIYSSTTFNDGSELVVASKQNTIYAPTTVLPTGLGYLYVNGVMLTARNTIFLNTGGILGTVSMNSVGYDGYQAGNFVQGAFTTFTLFGQLYLFDGLAIYIANLANGIYLSKDLLTNANGMQYIATTPTAAFFLSHYDNSLYAFTGGRNLTKHKRFNMMPDIIKGTYNTRNNEIVLETTSSMLYIRDDVITENPKKANQTLVNIYSTKEGTILGNNTGQWQYTYNALVGSTIVPLDIQTAFFGLDSTPSGKSIVSKWRVVIYNKNHTPAKILGTSYVINTDKYNIQDFTWTINGGDYNDGGYIRLQLQPQFQKGLGSSLRIRSNDKILIMTIAIEYEESDVSVIAKARTV